MGIIGRVSSKRSIDINECFRWVVDNAFDFLYICRRIMATKTADEFYCKMGTLSGELLNGHLFDSNGLIQRIVDLGPIADLQKMREKHLFNITPWKDRRGLRFATYFHKRV